MAVFPVERWPADVDVEALDGTTAVETGLPYIAKGTGPTSIPSYEVQYNRREARLNRILAGWRQGMVVDEGDLHIGVYPIAYTLGGYRRVFLGASGVAVPDDAVRVVYLDGAGVLQVAEAWPADVTAHLPLAVVEALAGQVTIVDMRTEAAFHVPSVDVLFTRDRRSVGGHAAALGAGLSAAEIFRYEADGDLGIDQVQVYCTGTSGTVSVDVKVAGASVLAARATPAAGAVVKPTVSQPAVASGAMITVHVTTDGSGSVSNLAVTLLLAGTLGG